MAQNAFHMGEIAATSDLFNAAQSLNKAGSAGSIDYTACKSDTLNAKQRQNLQAALDLAQQSGTDILITKSGKDANGKTVGKSGYIDGKLVVDIDGKFAEQANSQRTTGFAENSESQTRDGTSDTGKDYSGAWAAIDDYRTSKDAMTPLGEGTPAKGDQNGTVAYIEVNGEKAFGVNSGLLSDEEKNLGRQYYAKMVEEGKFTKCAHYGSGDAQVFTHAEGHALMKAVEQFGDKLGKEVTIYCDRKTCGICNKNLPVLKKYFKLETLTVINKNGEILIY